MDEPRWTLDELARRARQALASDGVRAPNGRVRELGDDGRAIRWYGTKGLVDRPEIGPGHSARYGPRHLLQLVAVKRLQARGMTLAAIQRELAGATETELQSAAEIELSALIESAESAGPARAPASMPDRRFWAAAPMAAHATAASAAPAAPAEPVVPAPEIRYLIPLTEDVTLTLSAPPEAADLEAIRAAAAPLLDLLAERGLVRTEPNPRT